MHYNVGVFGGVLLQCAFCYKASTGVDGLSNLLQCAFCYEASTGVDGLSSLCLHVNQHVCVVRGRQA